MNGYFQHTWFVFDAAARSFAHIQELNFHPLWLVHWQTRSILAKSGVQWCSALLQSNMATRKMKTTMERDMTLIWCDALEVLSLLENNMYIYIYVISIICKKKHVERLWQIYPPVVNPAGFCGRSSGRAESGGCINHPRMVALWHWVYHVRYHRWS